MQKPVPALGAFVVVACGHLGIGPTREDLNRPNASSDGAPTRSAVIAAASSLLEAGGPEAVTLRSVGAAAGVSRSAPYRHFEDKADLLSALALQTLTDLGQVISSATVESEAGSTLQRACSAYLGYAVKHPHHYLLIFGDTPMSEPTREVVGAADAGMQALTDLVERAQHDGDLGDGPPRELATVVWALVHGLAQLHITGHFSEPRTVDGDRDLELLLALALKALRPTS